LQCGLYGDEVTRRCLSHRREDGDLAHVVVVCVLRVTQWMIFSHIKCYFICFFVR
jgi:hypothetical protein